MKGKRLVAIAAVAAMVLMASASHAEVNFQFRTVVLTVPGLTQSLAPHVIEILGEVEGVQLVQTDVAARTVTVTYAASETNTQDFEMALHDLGLEVTDEKDKY